MLDKIISWLADEIAKLRKLNQPETMYRPLSASRTSNWTYTAPATGILYLAIISAQRSYVTISWNNADIGDYALPTDPNNTGATTIPVAVKKGQTITVRGLTSNCYLSTRTALVAWGGGYCLTRIFQHLQPLFQRLEVA